MSFADELRREKEAAINAVKEAVKVTAFDAFNTAIIISPVGNTDLWDTKYPPAGYVGGRFRSNWLLSFGSQSIGGEDSIVSEQVKKGQLLTILSSPYESKYTYSNSVPYAQRLDNGHSTQAPTGITAPVELRMKQRITENYKAAKRKYGVKD